LNNIEYIESDDLNYYENKGYDSLNLTANSTFDNSDIVLENSGLFETDESLKMSIIDQINVFKNKKSSNRKSTIISDDIPTNKNILIPHGSIPVCEINNPNHLMCAYPTLFPYGIGGIMDPLRKIKLTYRNHVVHLLSLNSDHFSTNNSFSFVAFNIIQRAEARSKIHLLIKKTDFKIFSKELKSITLKELDNMAYNYIKHHTFDQNSIINRLFQKVQSASACVQGSRASLKHRRNDLRGYMIFFGLPTFFITISPADVHNPLILFIGGIKINLDSIGLDKSIFRSDFVRNNPFLQAIFFNMVIETFLEFMIGYSDDIIKNQGILGITEAYYGPVEGQQRGALHDHFMFWLFNNLNPEEYKIKLQCPIFVER
jgi:hypothetical protein